MARKISQKIKNASDNMVQRFTSPKIEFGDSEYATSDDNYDLIIDELDYVNTQIAKIGGNAQQPANTPHIPKNPKPKRNRAEWNNADELKKFFPTLSHIEITEKLCQLQQSMPDKIIKLHRQMALHTSALAEFAKKAGLRIATPKKSKPTKAQKLKKSKAQITDMNHVIYVIDGQNKSVAKD